MIFIFTPFLISPKGERIGLYLKKMSIREYTFIAALLPTWGKDGKGVNSN